MRSFIVLCVLIALVSFAVGTVVGAKVQEYAMNYSEEVINDG